MGLIECGWATCDERDLVEKEAVATFTPPMLRSGDVVHKEFRVSFLNER